jgi:hypothetical protein
MTVIRDDRARRRAAVESALAANVVAVARLTRADPLAGHTKANRQALEGCAATLGELADARALADPTLLRLHLDEGGAPGAPRRELSSNPLGIEDPVGEGAGAAGRPSGIEHVGGPAYGDATGEAVLTPDAAVVRARAIRTRIATIDRQVAALVDELLGLAPVGRPQDLTDDERRRIEAGNAKHPCEHCLHVHIVPGTPWECVADVRYGDVGGRLRLKHHLCRACRARVESSAPSGTRRGVLPELAAVRQHRDRADRRR